MFSVNFKSNEYFWGGASPFGTDMPISADKSYCRDFRSSPRNQFMPLFLSNKGRYIWSEKPFKVWTENGKLCFEGEGEFSVYEAGNSLKDAYLGAMERYFPFTATRKQGKKLNRKFFQVPQYNTWMEFTYNPTEEGVLDYAKKIIDNGFKPGILMIDEGWQTRYGLWEFDLHKFPHPKEMIEKLHKMGFTVMLWVTPLFTCDGQEFVTLTRSDLNPEFYDKIFLRNREGEVAFVQWWNGYSAILDLRRENDQRYFSGRLNRLIEDYGVDGFKFDGGSYHMYTKENIINGTPAADHDAEALNNAWNEFGAKYEFHEYKDSYKQGGKAMIQRLCDRNHSWDNDGINTLIPSAIMQGLLGYPFICPDMIGGGEWTYRINHDFKPDQELFVRMAQASALFPMMQFSWAPWDALSSDNLNIVKDAAALHDSMADTITKAVENAEQTGEPILRNLEYNYPNCGYAEITDEFMIGEDILVCPIVTKGTFNKDIVFPCGRWQDSDGNIYEGGIKNVPTPLNRLAWFKKV